MGSFLEKNSHRRSCVDVKNIKNDNIHSPLFRLLKGFTLAEVLITLGIIGVVAAMTIPTLMTKYQQEVYVTKMKSTYSLFQQAFRAAEAEHGDPTGWDFGEGSNNVGGISAKNTRRMVDTYIVPYIKVNIEKSSSDAYVVGTLNNGTSVVFHIDTGNDGTNYYPKALYVVVSTNGKKVSPLWGGNGEKRKRDYSRTDFCLVYDLTISRLHFFNWGGPTRKGKINDSSYGCNSKKPRDVRYNCAALIQQDSWKILSDYPWKN